MANRMQVDRRKESIPWTWEPFVGGLLLYVFLVLVIAQLARAIAYLLAGEGLRWPAADAQVSSAFAVFAGHSTAGLPGARVPAVDTTWLYICLATFEVLGLIVLTWAGIAALRRWGPARMLGMATRAEAQRLLGTARLRSHAGVIRPDLHGHGRHREAPVAAFDLEDGPTEGIQVVEPSGLRTLTRDLAVFLLGQGRG
ncbi:MAG: hypothetical protein NVSMB48_00300 [Marmoricola sp.]